MTPNSVKGFCSTSRRGRSARSTAELNIFQQHRYKVAAIGLDRFVSTAVVQRWFIGVLRYKRSRDFLSLLENSQNASDVESHDRVDIFPSVFAGFAEPPLQI